MGFYGFLINSHGFLWISIFLWWPMAFHGFLWISMDFYRFLWMSLDFFWVSVDFYGFLQMSIDFYDIYDFHGCLWISMGFSGCLWFLWVPMDSLGFLWSSIDFYGCLWIFMNFYWVLWLFSSCPGLSMVLVMVLYGSIDFYGCLWMSMNVYGVLWLSMDFHDFHEFPWSCMDFFFSCDGYGYLAMTSSSRWCSGLTPALETLEVEIKSWCRAYYAIAVTSPLPPPLPQTDTRKPIEINRLSWNSLEKSTRHL